MPKHPDTAAGWAQGPSHVTPRGNGAPSDPTCPQAWMSGPDSIAPGFRFDPSVPHPARVYGYWLGGKDHYPADREVAEEVIRRRPGRW